MRNLFVIFILLFSIAILAAKYRRPFANNIGVNYGFDNNYGSSGCRDFACGSVCYDGHGGTDFPLVVGTNVLAPASGKVIATYNGCANYGGLGNTCGGRCGNYVKIDYGGGYTTLFCHLKLNSIVVSTGQQVSCGQKVGQSASSGNSSGPHLHFGTYINGVTRDPFKGNCATAASLWVNQGNYPHNIPSSTCATNCACTPGRTETASCGNCGTKKRTCGSNCQWGSWSGCSGQGVCVKGSKQTQGCGNCGAQSRICSNSCQWGSWSSCINQGVCVKGTKQTQGCGNCGTQSRTCSNSCQWNSWGSCAGQGVCAKGVKQTQGCGNCGTQSRTCSNSCQWNSWGSCLGEGVCAIGTIQTENCCDCGIKNRKCSNSCQWNSWSSCDGPDPDNGNRVCNTGEFGVCDEGRVHCVSGCFSCDRVNEPSDEFCDGLDNNCDGETDEGEPEMALISFAEYAATFLDMGGVEYLSSFEEGYIWAKFRNDGNSIWYKDTVWVEIDEEFSIFEHPKWEAFNVPIVLNKNVFPGEEVDFIFPIKNSFTNNDIDYGDVISEKFYLAFGRGSKMRCPKPHFTINIIHSNNNDETYTIQLSKINSNNDNNNSGCYFGNNSNQNIFILIFIVLVLITIKKSIKFSKD